MSKISKPRTWLVRGTRQSDAYQGAQGFASITSGHWGYGESVEVIEKSAYDAVVADYKAAAKAVDESKDATALSLAWDQIDTLTEAVERAEAERDALRGPPTDAEVEAAAKAAHYVQRGPGPNPFPWERVPEEVKKHKLREARAALTAARAALGADTEKP